MLANAMGFVEMIWRHTHTHTHTHTACENGPHHHHRLGGPRGLDCALSYPDPKTIQTQWGFCTFLVGAPRVGECGGVGSCLSISDLGEMDVVLCGNYWGEKKERGDAWHPNIEGGNFLLMRMLKGDSLFEFRTPPV